MVNIYILSAGQPLKLKGKVVGFYLYRDLMGKIEMDIVDSNGGNIVPLTGAKWIAVLNEESTEKKDGKEETGQRRKRTA